MGTLIDLLLDTKTRPTKRYRIFFNNMELSDLSKIIFEDDTLESIFGKLLIVLKSLSYESLNELHINNVCMLYKTNESSYDLMGVYRKLPFPLNYLENPVNDNYDPTILNRIHQVNHTPEDERKKILDDYNIFDNVIKMYDIRYLLENKSLNLDGGNQRDMNGYIKKYWPFIENESVKEINSAAVTNKHKQYVDKEIRRQVDELNDQLQINEDKEKIRKMVQLLKQMEELSDKKEIHELKNKIKKEEFKTLPQNFMFYHLCIQKDLSKIIDIKLLFNNLSLNHDIPVSILNLENYSDSRFKIFKDSTEELTLQQFKQWKSGIVLVPHLFETASYYNRKINCVTFCVNVSNGLSKSKKYAVVNISSDGLLEMITEKSTMNSVSLNKDTDTNINFNTIIDKVNKILDKCNYYNSDISNFDTDFLKDKDSNTKIKELGGKIVYNVDVSCDQEREHFDTLMEKKKNQYKSFIRIREEDIPEKRKKDRETLYSTGHTFVYKKISEYTKLDSVEAMIMPFIINIYSHDQQASVIRYVLKALYNDDEKFTNEARKLVENTVNNYNANNSIKRKRIERGVSCRIEDVGRQIHFYFDSIKNFNELQRLTQFVTIMINKTINNDDLHKKFKGKLIKKSSSPKDEDEDEESSRRSTISEAYAKVESESALEEDGDGDEDEAGDEAGDEEEDSSSEDSSSSSVVSVGGGKILLKQYHTKLIEEHDENLIGWDGQTAKGGISAYSIQCPAYKTRNRQPYIIPDIEEVERIKNLWSNKEFGFNIDNAFGENYSDSKMFRNSQVPDDGKEYIRWIKATSGHPDQIAFYICNRYWCVNCKTPIPGQHFLQYKTYSDRKKNAQCPFCECGYFGAKDDGKVKELVPQRHGTILERVEEYWSQGKGKIESEAGHKLPGDDIKYLPGYLKPHPVLKSKHTIIKGLEDYYGRVPCCYKTKQYKDNDPDSAKKDRHMGKDLKITVTTWNKILHQGEIGAINPDINKIINEDDEFTLGRYGVEQDDNGNKNGLLNSLSIIYFNDINKSYTDLIDALELHKKDLRFFCKANNGDLISKFKTPYDKLSDTEINDIIDWLGPVLLCSSDFKKFYKFKKVVTIEKFFDIFKKEKESIKQWLKENSIKKFYLCSQSLQQTILIKLLDFEKEEEELEKLKELKELKKLKKLKELHKEEIIKWIYELYLCSQNFKKFYKLKSVVTKDNFFDILKNEPEFRVLCNIYTAYSEFLKKIHTLDYDNVLPVIQELEHNQAVTKKPDKTKNWDDREKIKEERYICLFEIKSDESKGVQKPKINIVYPARYYKDLPSNMSMSYLVKTNQTYTPLINTDTKPPTPIIKLNKKLVDWCFREHNKDTLGTATLPVINYDTLNNIPKLVNMSQSGTFKYKFYYVDSLSIARYLILKLSPEEDKTNIKSVILPISPYKILDIDGNQVGGTEMWNYKDESGADKVYSLFSQYHIKKGNAFNIQFSDIPTHTELERILNKINQMAVFNKQYLIDGIFVDVTKNKAVGYSVNNGHIVYFKEMDHPEQDEHLKHYKQLPYINDEEVEKNIFIDEINKVEQQEQSDRSEYKKRAINESLLYKQYTLEVSSAITQADSIVLKKLADMDLSMDDTEKYLYKSMWYQDKRDRIRDIVLNYTKKHTKDGNINPFDAYAEDDRQIQNKCNRRIYKKNCNRRPLCKYSGKTCKLILGGKSYWSTRPLKDLFIEMLTDDIYYGGLKAVKILNREIKAVDPRLSSIYKSSDREIILTPIDIRDEQELLRIFNNTDDPNHRSVYSYSGGRKRTLKKKQKRRTVRKKKQARTHKKKKEDRTHKRNRKRRTGYRKQKKRTKK